MKISSVVAGMLVLVGVVVSGQAAAGCSGTALDETQLNTTFSNNTVCAMRGADRWQEYHRVGGDLIDFKMGPSHAVDPSKKVGTWSVTGSGTAARLAYDYGSGGSYTYQVFDNNGTYSFCNGSEMVVTVRSGQGACP